MTAGGADNLCLSLKEPTRGVILVSAIEALNHARIDRRERRLGWQRLLAQDPRQPIRRHGFRNRLLWKSRVAITERCALSFRATSDHKQRAKRRRQRNSRPGTTLDPPQRDKKVSTMAPRSRATCSGDFRLQKYRKLSQPTTETPADCSFSLMVLSRSRQPPSPERTIASKGPLGSAGSSIKGSLAMPVGGGFATGVRCGRISAAIVSAASLLAWLAISTGVPAAFSAAMCWRPGPSEPTGNATTQKPGKEGHGP